MENIVVFFVDTLYCKGYNYFVIEERNIARANAAKEKLILEGKINIEDRRTVLKYSKWKSRLE